jgi:hypothetical protein
MALVASELTEAMQAALRQEWQVTKGAPLPDAGLEDRRLLFAAVARGLLAYLEAHQNDWLNTITFEDVAGQSVAHKVKGADLNITVAP